MRARIICAAVLVGAALAVVASTASGGTAATNSITVWLQTDADKDNWKAIIRAATTQFQRDHPGVAVDVQFQTWGNHLQKFDATLAGGNAPDVIEMGNTEMTKYMAAGAFQDITSDRGSFANSSTWLDGPRGRRPLRREALRRPVLRRVAGSSPTGPTCSARRSSRSRPASRSSPRRRRSSGPGTTTRGFSPVYVAGTDWYVAMGFVYDHGGAIAQAGQRQVEGHARFAEGRSRG